MGYHWPPGIPQDTSLETFIAAFATLGYEECESSDFEPGFEKVAIYTINAACKHAARQLPNGQWTSKLGRAWDISHPLEGVEGEQYGQVAVILRRPLDDKT